MPTRRYRLRTAVAALSVACALVAAPATAAAASTERLVVGFSPSSSASARQSVLLHGAGVPRHRMKSALEGGVPRLGAAVIEVPASEAARVRRSLLSSGAVSYVEVDHRAHAYGVVPAASDGVPALGASPLAWRPDDTFLGQQWALGKVGAASAWDFARGTGVTIAIVDTGVDTIHPDLQGKVVAGKDFVDDDLDAMDVQGHGTHVAGIAAANADDTFGVAGLAPAASILPVRVLDAQGSGDYSDVANGIVWAADQGARVINLSLGGPEGSELLRQAIDYASARGAIVTCATGNEGASAIGFPARYANCVAVGATDAGDRHASFSNAGPGIDLAAPGAQVLSSTMGGSHEAWDGTSMATPYASGLAALLFSQGLTRAQAMEALVSTAKDLGPAGRDVRFGAGRIDAAAATLAGSRMPRAGLDEVAPTVTEITVGAARTRYRTSSVQRWRRTSSTRWRAFDRTTFPGAYSWHELRTQGARRTWIYYRTSRYIVYRRTLVQRRVRVVRRTPVRVVSITVTATDAMGVDRVALDRAGRTVGVDWSGADGWRFELPCVAGRHEFTAWAYDAADNEAGGRATRTVRC